MPFLVEPVQCEMCGSTVPQTRRFQIESTVLNVCSRCERFGKSLEPAPKKAAPVLPGDVPGAMDRRQKRMGERDVYAAADMQFELVEDFAPRIRTAREKRGWTRQDLGSKVGEREVSIGHIESGALRPTDEVARRMERELGIHLFEPVRPAVTTRAPRRGLTLGDVLKDALKKGAPDEDEA